MNKRFICIIILFIFSFAFSSCNASIFLNDVPIDSTVHQSKTSFISTTVTQTEKQDKSEPETTVAVIDNKYEYNIPQRYYSKGIENIVKRARQISGLKWKAYSDLASFDNETVFKKGTEIYGIPYGQPVFSGSWVCYETDLETFITESRNANSLFYTDRAEYEESSPYYSMDCSTFICYVWERPNRMIASLLTQFGDYNENDINNVQVGDALIRTERDAHTVLVTGIKEDSNNRVVWVEITEQTHPLTKITRYGENETLSLDDFKTAYLNDGYNIYRNTDYRDNITYTHICNIAPEEDKCEKCANDIRQ